MNKRILSIVCALAIVVGMIIPWTGDVHAAEATTCKCGAPNVTWEALTETTTIVPGGHYRLERDVHLPLQLGFTTEEEAGTYCFDLAGHTLHTADSKRSFLLGKSDGSVSVTVNVMDSSAAQTGRVEGFGTSAGGLIYIWTNCTLNIYGGTFINTNSGTNYGGIFNLRKGASLNMYGGKMVGITVSGEGGVGYMYSGATLNVSGGEIISGTSTGNKGDCINAAAGALINLSNSAKIDEIYFANAAAASGLTISGRYTGKVALNFATAPTTGTQIGVSDGATIGLDSVYVLSPRMYGTVSGNTLVATALSGVAVKSGTQTTTYATLTEACENLKKGNTIKLLADNSEDVTIPVDATLDLFGWDLTGKIEAAGTLTLKDSATDDFVAEDPMGVGVVSGTIAGDVQAAKNYIALKEADGTTTYHKYVLKLTNVSLRPREAGVYYKADIKVDEMVREKQVQFGIAASVYDTEPSLVSEKTLCTSFGKEDYNNGATKGALFKDFLDNTNNTVAKNTENAQTNVYGRPYLQYTDENGKHCLYGAAYGTNLKTITEQVGNASRDSLQLVQKRALTDMYEAYEDTLKTWDLSYLTTAAENKKAAADDGVLKVLLIGNSHALDSSRMLYEVFQKENPDQEVIIGVMYHSGANMGNHMSYMLDDLAQYEYHKNGDTDVDTMGDGRWRQFGTSKDGVKIARGLNNENWDIVALQEMNNQSATESEFQDDQIELVLDYVNEHLGYEPEIWWNMVWVNPQIPLTEEARQAFPADSSTGNPDEEQTGSGTDTSGAPALWIFPGGGGPGMKKAWINRYFDNWQNDRDVMFNDIIGNVETYVLESGKQAKAYDVTTVVPVASAVQRAVDQLINNSTYSSLLGTNKDMVLEDAARITTAYAEQVLYRDYTHMSELGRYITAYVWYAKLMELDSLSTLKCTAMPNYLRKGYEDDKTLPAVTFTTEQRALARDAINYALSNPFATYPESTAS